MVTLSEEESDVGLYTTPGSNATKLVKLRLPDGRLVSSAAVDRAADLGGRQVHLRRLGGDRHALGEPADLQRAVDLHGGAYPQQDVLDLILVESRQLRFQAIRTRDQRGDRERAVDCR